jgi:hypothetical protein
MRIAIQPQYEPEPYRLPHQAMWFVVLFLVLFMLAGKKVAATCDEDPPRTASQCVIV